MAAYERLQRKATAMALIHANRAAGDRAGAPAALACLGDWLKVNSVGAAVLDLPETLTTQLGGFVREMVEAKGGLMSG